MADLDLDLWERACAIAARLAGRPYPAPKRPCQWPTETDCSTTKAYVLQGLCPELAGDWARLVLATGAPWGALELLVERGVGTWCAVPPTEPGTYACQRWQSTAPLLKGHAWLAHLYPDGSWERIDADRRPHGALRVGRVTWGEMTAGAEVRCVRLAAPTRL
jgi:hypothetical protein